MNINRPHLRLVANSEMRNNRSRAPVDYAAAARTALRWVAFAWVILMAPLRLLGAIGRLAVATGIGLFRGLFKLIMGAIGLAFILFFANAMLHVVLYPLFQAH